ncbi:MAG: 23S rRNA (pseudouridine(1915)-N(3))-methyltransferase RlmH [Desulfobacterales bacterium]|nr:23S rRNA (pseudouridine(1915)-N(3))-methyltransferase RlmH [Deltaproteobacteria bacterium]NNK92862.1 23S rRNA (pseudouridine(1915)-N(3))-methyltransferase RlmH [Desulfobacterales bacterium]
MKIKLLFLGKTKEDYLAQGIDDFSKRLSHYTRLEICYIKVKTLKSKSDPEIRAYENVLLNNHIDPSAYRVALDNNGTQLSSEQLSEMIDRLEKRSIKKLCFVIGGPLGLDNEQKQRADIILSLSSMTFTHDMCRLLLLEQLYRAYTIKAGEKYHK